MADLNRKPGETEEQFLWRVGRAYDAGEIDINWDQIAEIVNRQFRDDVSEYKEQSAYRKAYRSAKRFYEAGVFNDADPDKYIDQIKESTRELKKEKIKLQTEKLEYNRWLREDARDEMIAEKFADAIRSITPLSFPSVSLTGSDPAGRSGIVCFGDEHFGADFQILGLGGEILNAYSPEIFEKRMMDLLNYVVSLVYKEGLKEIRVYSLGDSTDGLLRVGQLMKLRYGVVDQAVIYANFIANWLNELTRYVRVKFQMVFGNHSELRFFNQKKGSFTDENVGKFIREIIKARLDGNPNFEMETNPTGLIFDTVENYKILGIHGEVKDMEQAIKDFSNTYRTNVDILIGGHWHHLREETVGYDRDVVIVPSVIGIDDFSLSLNKTSRPGASFLIVEKGKGIVTEHRIKL